MKKLHHRLLLIGAIGVFMAIGLVMLITQKPSGRLSSSRPSTHNLEKLKDQPPAKADNDSADQRSRPGGGSVASSSSQGLTGQTAGKTLVRFASSSARAAFIKNNNLTEGDLVPLEQLDVYSVNAANLKPADGAEVFSTQRYRASLTPTDTFYSQQWHLGKVGAPATWNNTMGSSSVVVAVIDTGFALTHQDLSSKWAINSGENGATTNEGMAPNCTSRGLILDKSCNNLDDDGDGYTDNKLGWDFTTDTNSVQAGETNSVGSGVFHATFVSGLIAADTNNAQGVSGVSWASRLLPVQALTDEGDGDTVSVALAIHYAVTHGAKVINMSLGSSGDDPLVAEQVQYAAANGVTVVAAAGNDGAGTLSYPANYPGVIAVGATDSSDNRASFSNYGANLALMAPGTSSLCSTGWAVTRPSDYYVCGYSGTSFSSPIVAGAAALLLAQNPNLTPTQVKAALTSTATKVAGMSGQNFTTRYGYGRLDVYSALKAVSLVAPRAQVLNTRTVSLAAASGVYRPSMNSTCVTYVTSATCEMRAINTVTNQVVALGNSGLDSSANIYWGAGSLSQGTWLVQARALLSGQASLVEENTLVIQP